MKTTKTNIKLTINNIKKKLKTEAKRASEKQPNRNYYFISHYN